MTSATIGDMDSIKARLKSIWTAGDYDRFSRFMEGGAREFYERLNFAPGCKFLDIACGSGQLALMAAKDGIEVTGVDIAGNLVERARARARAEGLNARFEEADAELLPFADASFDVVATLIGAMFAPQPQLVAQELLRVCARRHHRHGQLDAPRVRWTDVQGRIKIHRSVRDAGACLVG
jgi:ubiquinone/menaquinone biosynthesis C-methylase UbiE